MIFTEDAPKQFQNENIIIFKISSHRASYRLDWPIIILFLSFAFFAFIRYTIEVLDFQGFSLSLTALLIGRVHTAYFIFPAILFSTIYSLLNCNDKITISLNIKIYMILRIITLLQIGAIILGMIFNKVAWGVYWSWDPLELRAFMLFCILLLITLFQPMLIKWQGHSIIYNRTLHIIAVFLSVYELLYIDYYVFGLREYLLK